MDIYVLERIKKSMDLTEDLLSSGELIVEGRLVDASNATLFGRVQFSIDSHCSVVYKPIAGERPLWDFPDGDLASREVAAYLLSKNSGLSCVPITVMRDGPFGPGAVQQWIEIDEAIDFISFAQQDHPAIRRLALFDVIINNTDRKFGHVLIDASSNVFGCDHGVSFHEDYKLRTVLWQFAGKQLTEAERAITVTTRDWITGKDGAYFRSLLTQSEVEACCSRIDMVLEDGFPYPSEDWPSIPWPPV